MLQHEASDLAYQLQQIMDRSDSPISDSHGVLISKKMLKEVIDQLGRWDYELTCYSEIVARVSQKDNPIMERIDLHIDYVDMADENLTMDAILNNIINHVRMRISSEGTSVKSNQG